MRHLSLATPSCVVRHDFPGLTCARLRRSCHLRHSSRSDVKPENLLSSFVDGIEVVKLADFGSAVRLDHTGVAEVDPVAQGTTLYSPPEVLHGRCYTFAADVWAAGITTYVLISGYFPFGCTDDALSAHPSFEGDNWREVPLRAKDFILECLQHDPAFRPSAEESMMLPWLRYHAPCHIPPLSQQPDSPRRRLAASLPPHAATAPAVVPPPAAALPPVALPPPPPRSNFLDPTYCPTRQPFAADNCSSEAQRLVHQQPWTVLRSSQDSDDDKSFAGAARHDAHPTQEAGSSSEGGFGVGSSSSNTGGVVDATRWPHKKRLRPSSDVNSGGGGSSSSTTVVVEVITSVTSDPTVDPVPSSLHLLNALRHV